MSRVERFIKKIKRESAYFRALIKHPETPRLSRWLLIAAFAYLITPLDIIPDWIPVLGQLDDLLIVPALVYTAVVIIPSAVKKECRDQTADSEKKVTQGGQSAKMG